MEDEVTYEYLYGSVTHDNKIKAHLNEAMKRETESKIFEALCVAFFTENQLNGIADYIEERFLDCGQKIVKHYGNPHFSISTLNHIDSAMARVFNGDAMFTLCCDYFDNKELEEIACFIEKFFPAVNS